MCNQNHVIDWDSSNVIDWETDKTVWRIVKGRAMTLFEIRTTNWAMYRTSYITDDNFRLEAETLTVM